jgi:hypothetical protein
MALYWQIRDASIEKIQGLYDRGLSPGDLEESIEWAARLGRDDALNVLLEGAKLETLNSVLTTASRYGSTKVAAMALDRGADIHVEKDRALCTAAHHGNVNTVKLLLDRGADVHAQGDLALQRAITNYNPYTAKLLLQYGADVTCKALGKALSSLYGYDMVLIVIDHVNIDILYRALIRNYHYAASLDIVKIIIGRMHYDDINVIAKPLFNAVRDCDSLECLTTLFGCGVTFRRSFLNALASYYTDAHVRHALSHGADISALKHITPEQKQTALDYERVL